MKREIGQFPFDQYYIYKIFHKNEQRYYICLTSINDEKIRHTISYARYLMSVKMGRFLTDEETVDHIDNDKLNDSIDNLQILSLADNNRKEANRIGKKMVILMCPNCHKIFERCRHQSNICRLFKITKILRR